VHDAFGDAFAVEVGVLLEELPVLHQQGAARPRGQGVLVVAHGDAGRGGEFAFFHGMTFLYSGSHSRRYPRLDYVNSAPKPDGAGGRTVFLRPALASAQDHLILTHVKNRARPSPGDLERLPGHVVDSARFHVHEW